MTVSLNLEKDSKVFSVTAFPKVVSGFPQEDVYSYKEDTEPLIEKLLLLDSVDFQHLRMGNLLQKCKTMNRPVTQVTTHRHSSFSPCIVLN